MKSGNENTIIMDILTNWNGKWRMETGVQEGFLNYLFIIKLNWANGIENLIIQVLFLPLRHLANFHLAQHISSYNIHTKYQPSLTEKIAKIHSIFK